MMRRLGRYLSSVPPTQRDSSGTIATHSPLGVGASAASHVTSSPSSCLGSMRFCSSAAIRTALVMPPPRSVSSDTVVARENAWAEYDDAGDAEDQTHRLPEPRGGISEPQRVDAIPRDALATAVTADRLQI